MGLCKLPRLWLLSILSLIICGSVMFQTYFIAPVPSQQRWTIQETTQSTEWKTMGTTKSMEAEIVSVFFSKNLKFLNITSLMNGDRSSTRAASRADIAELFSRSSLSNPSKPKRILLYTPIWDNWASAWLTREHLKRPLETSCRDYHCSLSYEKTDFNRSDAVVFHIRDIPSTETLRALMKIKPAHQRWVFFILENPHFTWLKLPEHNGMFNWTMTYARDSDILAPYGRYYETPPSNHTEAFDFAKGKDKLVFWPVSNCGQTRERVALKLAEYIPIDVFGKCKSKFPKRSPDLACSHNGMHHSEDCNKLKRRYKFRLSFENKNCKDYITEKYWDELVRGSIPIVLGGASYDPEVAVPGSFINVLDFPSIKALAEHIKYLDQNDTAYNEYFTWRKKYTVETLVETSFACGLCAALHLDLPPKVYNDIDKFWGIEQNCGIHLNKTENMAT